jgi:hypothetical protein
MRILQKKLTLLNREFLVFNYGKFCGKIEQKHLLKHK